MPINQKELDEATKTLTIWERRYCAVCGCPIKVKVQNKGMRVINPHELLCEFHNRVVNLIMDGFQQMTGSSAWKYGPSSEFERGGWVDFIRDNLEVLTAKFQDFGERKHFYRPPSDYTGMKGRQVCT